MLAHATSCRQSIAERCLNGFQHSQGPVEANEGAGYGLDTLSGSRFGRF